MRGLALERRVVVAVTRYLGVALGSGVARCGVLLRRIARLARRIACLAGCATPATPSPPSPPAAASIGAGSALANLRAFVELSGGRTVGVVVSGLAAPAVLLERRCVGASLTLGIAVAVAIASAAPSSAATYAVPCPHRRLLAIAQAWRARCAVSRWGGVELLRVRSFFHEISDVEKCVALQADLHKARLHPRKHARHAPVVDRSGERVLVLALVVNFGEGFVFDDGQTRLVGRAGDKDFFRHLPALSARSGFDGPVQRAAGAGKRIGGAIMRRSPRVRTGYGGSGKLWRPISAAGGHDPPQTASRERRRWARAGYCKDRSETLGTLQTMTDTRSL